MHNEGELIPFDDLLTYKSGSNGALKTFSDIVTVVD